MPSIAPNPVPIRGPLIFFLLAAASLWSCAMIPQPHAQSSSSFWPKGKTYAVSLTYDDGLPSQWQVAVPQLKEAGLRGTFYFDGKPGRGFDAAALTSMLQAGHELAAHTLLHPCDRSLSFVKPGQSLQDYDDQRMSEELDANVSNLLASGAPRGNLSFAYPCGQTYIGEDKHSYVPLVRSRFRSARGVGNRLADPRSVDLYDVPIRPGDKPAAELLQSLREAAEQGAWAVYLFHGTGGDYLDVKAEDHRALLAALKADPQAWVAPFVEVAAWVEQHRPNAAH